MPQLKEFHKAATVGSLGHGDAASVMVGGIDVLLARVGDEYFAIDNYCSHEEALLSTGQLDASLCEVECPLHESRFDLRTGQPTQMPATVPVETFAVRVEGEDILIGPKAAG